MSNQNYQNTRNIVFGTCLALFFLSPSSLIAYGGITVVLLFTGLAYFISTGWVKSNPNEWLLIIENGVLKKAGVGLKTFKWFNQQSVTFPSTITGVEFSANQVTKENFGIEIEGIVFWAVHRDKDGPFKCYKYTQGSDANENVKQVTESIVRSHISNTKLLSVLQNRVELRESVTKQLKEQLFGWGIWPETVEITEVRVSSSNLFKDMQTEFRFKHKQLAQNARQKSESILSEDRAKYDLTLKTIKGKNATELNQYQLDQRVIVNNSQQEYNDIKADIDKRTIELDNQINVLRSQCQAEEYAFEEKNRIEIEKLDHEYQQKDKELWMGVQNKMNDKNFLVQEIQSSERIYSSLSGMNMNIQQYAGPDNLAQIAQVMPAVQIMQKTMQ